MRENNRTKIIIYSIIIAIVMCTAIITLGIILSRKSSQKMTPKQDSTNQQTNSTSINNSDTDIKDDEANYIYQDVVLLSSTETDIVSSLAQINNNNIKIKNTTVELSNLGEIVDSDHSEELVNTFLTLRGYTSMDEFIASLNFNSQTANNPNGAAGKVFVESSTNSQDGIIIFMTENHEMNGPRIKDLTVGE
jgi:hypothetical protein